MGTEEGLCIQPENSTTTALVSFIVALAMIIIILVIVIIKIKRNYVKEKVEEPTFQKKDVTNFNLDEKFHSSNLQL